MPRLTLALAVFLVVLGLVAYVATGRQSVTALIPAFLGLPLLACALLERRGSARWPGVTAGVLAALGLAGTAGGVVKVLGSFRGQPIERPEAAVVQAAVAVACLLYLVVRVGGWLRRRSALALEEA